MSLILSGTDGLSDVDGTAATPAIRGTDANTGIFFPAADTIAFAEGGAEVARFDSSGNFGLGVTPSAWGAGTSVIDLATSGNAGAVSASGTLSIAKNGFFNGTNWIYKNTSSAMLYQLISSEHRWSNAASGTAGNAITFTQAMTLDASGNLGIGTTSPSQRLHLNIGSATAIYNRIQNSAGDCYLGLDTSGNTNLSADNTGNQLIFKTQATERSRIDSSGNLLVGTTSANNSRLNAIKGDATGPVIRAESSSGSFTGTLFEGYGGRTTTNGSYNLISVLNGDASGVFKVLDSGNAQNTNNSYGAISDIKLKENVIDATPKLEKLNQVRVVNYNLIGSEQKQIGVIAQELEQIFPGMVEETADKDMEGNDLGTTTKAVKYSVFVPMLIKAMQEQQAIITQLTARITALESA